MTAAPNPLEQLVTSVDLPRDGLSDLFRSTYINGNPNDHLLEVRATRSTAGAHGFVYLRNAALYEFMDELADKDLAIAGSVSLIIDELLNYPKYFEPADESEAAKDMAKLAEDVLLNMSGDLDLENALHTELYGLHFHGLGVQELVWRRRAKFYEPRAIVHRHPGQFCFDELGEMFVVDGRAAWTREKADDAKAIEPLKFAIARSRGARYGNPYGNPALMPLQYTYAFRKEALKAWVDYTDVFGFPLGKATIPTGTPNREQIRGALDQIFANLKRKAGISVPEGVLLEFVERGVGKGTAPFVELVKWLSEEETRFILGATLQVLDAQHGSRAQADTHERTADSRSRSRGSLLERFVQRGIVQPFFTINFPPGTPVPRFVLDMEGAEDLDATLKVLDQATKMGAKVAVKEVHERLGLPIPEDTDELIGCAREIPPVYLSSGIVTTNEVRAGLGLPPVAGGDVLQEPRAPEPLQPPGVPDEQAMFAALRGAPAIQFAKEAEGMFVERQFRARLRRVRDAVATEEIAHLRSLFDQVLRPIREGGPEGVLPDPRSLRLQLLAAPVSAATGHAVAAARLLGITVAAERLKAHLKPVRRFSAEDDAFAAMPPQFVEAARWMVQRQVITVAEVRALSETLAAAGGNLATAREIERAIRSEAQVLAIAHTRGTQAIEGLRHMLASAIAEGKSAGDFLEAYDGLVAGGGLPGGTDAHARTVYNTELANAYNHQRRAVEADPVFADHLWGYRIVTTGKETSRDSHAALHGKLVRRDSPAHVALGDPPWDYNCECLMVAIVVADAAEAATYHESPDLMDLIAALDRF